jgi:hypothetical protein
MQNKISKIFFALSVLLNALFFAFLFFALGKNVASFAFYDAGKEGGDYTSAAAIVSVPRSGSVIFGPLEITLAKGAQAAVQFSLIAEKNQMNIVNESLYDRKIIDVEKTGYGILIHGRSPGETVMQIISDDGIKDFAKIIVRETE